MNRYFPAIPPGTLAANLIGCYVIGAAVAFFMSYPAFAPEWRLFLTTGFCGGLTTFSTFSAEVVLLLQSGRSISALTAVAAHLIGFPGDDIRRHRHGGVAQRLSVLRSAGEFDAATSM